MICQHCNADNAERVNFCAGCGHALSIRSGVRGGDQEKHYASGKSPVVALVLSLAVVGLGQFYNSDAKKGVLMLVGALVMGIVSAGLLWFAFAIWSAIDAYRVAKQEKQLWI